MKTKNVLCGLAMPAVLIPALLMLVLAGGATASAQVVTNSADSGPGTLRSALTNADSGAVITFDPSLSGATITLASTLTINTNLTIDASALSNGLQINGNGSVQIFNVASSISVFLNSLTLTNGYGGAAGGGGIFNSGTLTLTNCILSGNSAYLGLGGGIYNVGTLTLNQCTLSGNSARSGPGGGGIYNDGLLTLNQCTLSGNGATYDGGGIGNGYDGTLTMNQCTLSGNGASGGGGIFNSGTLTLTNCILSGNSAANSGGGISSGGGIYNGRLLTMNQCTLSGNSANIEGGGIFNVGTLTLSQCTLSGNSVNYGGGGIYNGDTLTLNQCTLSGNYATYDGGGIYNYSVGPLTLNQCTLSGNGANFGGDIDNGSGTVTMTNTIVADTPGLTFLGANNLINSNPLLAPLGNYGGPTQTMPPLPGSPAIGAGSVAANTFSTDQRGYSRTQNGLIDLGAVELQSPAANPPVLENLTVPGGGGNGLQFTFTNAPAADFTVLTATNVSLALTNWTVLGEVQQVAPGQYQFTDPQAATNLARFYRVRSP
jgi:hypothetical protein